MSNITQKSNTLNIQKQYNLRKLWYFQCTKSNSAYYLGKYANLTKLRYPRNIFFLCINVLYMFVCYSWNKEPSFLIFRHPNNNLKQTHSHSHIFSNFCCVFLVCLSFAFHVQSWVNECFLWGIRWWGGVYNQHGAAEVKKAQERGGRTNKSERRDCIIKWVWQSLAN